MKAEARTYSLERRTVLTTSLDNAWQFFSNPRNLAYITPPDMGFHIRSHLLPGEFYTGMQIEYEVRPILRLPFRWVSEITDVVERKQFTDVQVVGPYASWVHRHEFHEVSTGVEMWDSVRYQMPFGRIGALLHNWVIKQRLEYIFDFRTQRIRFLFESL